MGQTNVKSVQGMHISCNVLTSGLEGESLLAENEPPDLKPPRKYNIFSGAKFTELKFKEHRAGGHTLVMISCVH
jgi:hypothetical protein